MSRRISTKALIEAAPKLGEHDQFFMRLGSFIDMFASVETALLLVVKHYARIDADIARAILSPLRVDNAINHLHRVIEVRRFAAFAARGNEKHVEGVSSEQTCRPTARVALQASTAAEKPPQALRQAAKGPTHCGTLHWGQLNSVANRDELGFSVFAQLPSQRCVGRAQVQRRLLRRLNSAVSGQK
jgi:hypothetical protein